jgi:hypothetical protein
MKSIAFECDREYILRDDGGPRLVTTSDLLLFHENGSYEVISKDNLQSIYRLDFSLDSNIRIYQKKVPCYVSKISEPFLVKQNSYYRQGNANEYFVQDLCAPFYQYVFSEQDYLKYLTVIMKSEDENVAQPDQDADAGYDGEEHEIDHHEEEEDNEEDVEVIETDHLEEKYAKVGARSSFFTRKFWNFHGENALAPPEEEDQISDPGNQRGSRRRNFESKKSPVAGDDFDIQSIASGDYLEPTEIPAPIILSEVSDQTTPHVGLPLTWNLKQGKYLGVVIHSSSFSIEFQDYPLTPQSERFRGRKGDFIVLNCRGYIFGILSPIDFSRLCDSQPFGYSPGNPENDHSSLHIIHNFLANKILTMQVQSISSALWDGSIELGRVGDYLMQLDFPGNSSMKFVTRSVNCSSSDGATGSLVIEDSIVSNDLYQWIASASDLEEYFSSFPHKSSPVLMEETKSHHPISIQNSTPPILKALIQEEQLAEMKEEEAHPCALAEPIIAPNSWINRRDSLSIQQEVLLMPSILHYFSPFDIFTKDTCCWYGKLDRYLKKKSTWKTANFIIYCDRICLIPLESKKRRKSLTTRTAAATTATAATGTGIATGGGDGLKRMKYFNLSDCTDITIGTLNYRDCIQLHGIGKKKSHEEKKTLTVKSVFGAIPALFSPKDDSEYFAIRNQSRTQSIRDLGTLFERESFVNMNAIKQGELFKLFQECYLFGKRQKLYQLTYQLFEKEEEENRRGAGAGGGANGAGAGSKTLGFKKPSASSSSTSVSFNSMIEFFEDPKLSLSQIERILTSPVDESDGMLYLHKLASYPYQASVEITQFLLERFYNSIPSISPLRLCCQQQVDALHIAIRCNNLKMIKYFFHPQAPCSQEFRTSPYFVELSIQSYLCYTTTPTMFDLISSYYSPPLNLFTILDSQENTLLMLLLSRGSTSVVLHLLQTIPFLELFSMNQTNVTNYFKILNWKHQHALSLALSLFTFYSNTLTDSLCLEIQKVIMLLLEHGCDPNLSDLNGNNSIHLISSLFLTLLTNNSQRMIGYQMKLKTYLSIMKLFIQSHCDLLALNNKGETGLSIISQMTDYSIPEDTLKEVVDTLIGMPQDNGQAMSPHSGAGTGRTRSFSGAEVGNHLSKQLSIVNHSFGSRALFHSPHSPLHICAYNGHSRLLSHLINRGGDIHRQNQFGEKPMDIILKRQQTIQTLPPSPTVALLQHGLDECFTLLIEQKGNVKYHLERRKSTWNLKSRSSNDVIYGRHKDGHYEIQSGLVSALVPLLCQDKYSANEDDIRAVVSSYHLVAYNHVDVLRLVLGVIHEQIRQRQTPPEDRPVVGESDGVNDKEEEELDFKGVLSFLVVWFSWKRNELGTTSPSSSDLNSFSPSRILLAWRSQTRLLSATP